MMQRKQTLGLIAALGLAWGACAVPVTGWVQIIDVQTPSTGITDANTASPILGDADGATMAANFAGVTLADGEFIELTGTVSIDSPLVGNQFRWGLFDGDNPPVVDAGSGYVGIDASAADGSAANGFIGFGDGSATNPFSGSATAQLGNFPATGVDVAADVDLDFVLTIARDGANLDISASITNNIDYTQSLDLEDQVLTQYTYDTVAFLVGGSQNGTVSTFTDIDVSTGVVVNFDPADLDQDGDVDDADFGIAFAAFTGPNNGPSSNPDADLDGDGDVDDADFGIAFAAFTGPGGAAVPEPASLALLGLGGLLVARRRRA